MAPQLLVKFSQLLELQNLLLVHHGLPATELCWVLLWLGDDHAASHVTILACSELKQTRPELVKANVALAHQIVLPEDLDRVPILAIVAPFCVTVLRD